MVITGEEKMMAVQSPRGNLRLSGSHGGRIVYLATASKTKNSMMLARRPCTITLHLGKQVCTRMFQVLTLIKFKHV